MKKLFPILFLSVIVFFSCSKNAGSDNVSSSLIGKWLLLETLADPGDGSGTWQPANNSDRFVEFKGFNRMETNTYTGHGKLNQYRVQNDSMLNLINETGDVFTYHFKINNSLLTIRGGCIEACGNKFTKADER